MTAGSALLPPLSGAAGRLHALAPWVAEDRDAVGPRVPLRGELGQGLTGPLADEAWFGAALVCHHVRFAWPRTPPLVHRTQGAGVALGTLLPRPLPRPLTMPLLMLLPVGARLTESAFRQAFPSPAVCPRRLVFSRHDAPSGFARALTQAELQVCVCVGCRSTPLPQTLLPSPVLCVRAHPCAQAVSRAWWDA